ncbi:MAG: hypothetical protein LDL11_00100 [Desulfarculus sp.]|nr:hypothetical protein [Desulfarculus sp.]
MAFTFSNIAKVSAQNALNLGLAQAKSAGLGQTEANALGIANLMKKDEGSSLVNTLLGGDKNDGGRLRGAGLKNDLMAIGQAALAIGPGRSRGLSSSSSLGGSGSIFKTVV